MFNTKISDIKTKTYLLEDFELIDYIGETNEDDELLSDQPEYTLISSAYNMYIGSNNSFDLALGTKLSTSHDNYGKVIGDNVLVLNDFNRQVAEYDDLWLLQNNGKNVISVNGGGNVLISPQNVMVDSFSMFENNTDITLTVASATGNEAGRFYGSLVIGPSLASATSTEPMVAGTSEIRFLTDAEINAVGTSTLRVGQAGNTVDLNVEGVEYLLPEDARRDTISAFVAKPENNTYVWGKGENSWKPSDDIIITKIKVQYYCGSNGKVDLRLEDNNDQTLAELNGQICSENYTSIESDDLNINISSETGMHIVLDNVIGGYYNEEGQLVDGPSQLTITIEYVYEQELE